MTAVDVIVPSSIALDKRFPFTLFCVIRQNNQPVTDAEVKARLYNASGLVEEVDGTHLTNGIYVFNFADKETKYGLVVVKCLNYEGENYCMITRSDSYPEALIVRKINTNNWEIKDNQLLIYDDDGMTPLLVFNLYDKLGNPAEVNVFKRERQT